MLFLTTTISNCAVVWMLLPLGGGLPNLFILEGISLNNDVRAYPDRAHHAFFVCATVHIHTAGQSSSTLVVENTHLTYTPLMPMSSRASSADLPNQCSSDEPTSNA